MALNNSVRYLNLMVYPSVAFCDVTIDLSSENLDEYPRSIYIYNDAGRVVQKIFKGLDAVQEIDVSRLPRGNYVIILGEYLGKFTKL